MIPSNHSQRSKLIEHVSIVSRCRFLKSDKVNIDKLTNTRTAAEEEPSTMLAKITIKVAEDGPLENIPMGMTRKRIFWYGIFSESESAGFDEKFFYECSSNGSVNNTNLCHCAGG